MLARIKSFLGLDCYVSELDMFLNQYRQIHPSRSPATHQEKTKYAKLHDLRDHPAQPNPSQPLWDKF